MLFRNAVHYQLDFNQTDLSKIEKGVHKPFFLSHNEVNDNTFLFGMWNLFM